MKTATDNCYNITRCSSSVSLKLAFIRQNTHGSYASKRFEAHTSKKYLVLWYFYFLFSYCKYEIIHNHLLFMNRDEINRFVQVRKELFIQIEKLKINFSE